MSSLTTLPSEQHFLVFALNKRKGVSRVLAWQHCGSTGTVPVGKHFSSGSHEAPSLSAQNIWYLLSKTCLAPTWASANMASHSQMSRSQDPASFLQTGAPFLYPYLYRTNSPIHCSPCVLRAHFKQSLYCLQTVSSWSTGGPWPGSDIGRSPRIKQLQP